MKSWAQLFCQTSEGTLTQLLGSDGVVIFDGRLNLNSKHEICRMTINSRRNIHNSLAGYQIHNSSRFSIENPVTGIITHSINKDEYIDRVLFKKVINWNNEYEEKIIGGIKSFKGLDVVYLLDLSRRSYIELDGVYNNRPTTNEFIEFMKKHPNAKAFGYRMSPNRKDCEDNKVFIEGLYVPSEFITDELYNDFVEFSKFADEQDLDRSGNLRCWWD